VVLQRHQASEGGGGDEGNDAGGADGAAGPAVSVRVGEGDAAGAG